MREAQPWMESLGTRKSSMYLSLCVDILMMFHHILIFDLEFLTYITIVWR